MANVSKKDYEKFLNENPPEQGSDLWIIGGVIRVNHMWKGTYGTAVRKHDPTAFEVGYGDYKLISK